METRRDRTPDPAHGEATEGAWHSHPDGAAPSVSSTHPTHSIHPVHPENPSLGPLLVVFVSTRLLAILLLRPGGYFGDWNDYNFFKEMAELSSQGYYPYVHYWAEYPPVFPWLLVGAYQFSLLLPAWRHPMLWFQLPLSAILLLADAGNLWLIRRLGTRLWGERRGQECAWLYAGLFLPLYALSAWFDTLSVFWLLLGLELVLQRRALLAGLACGCGVAVKLFPGLLLPVALRALRGTRAWVRFGLGAALVPLAVFLPFYVISPTMLWASIRGILNRRSWETVWALLDGYYGTGGVAALSDRLLYPDSASWQNPSRLPWTAIGLAFAVVYVAVWWWAGLTSLPAPSPGAERGVEPSPPSPRGKGAGGLGPSALLGSVLGWARPKPDALYVVALTGFTVALFLLYSRGFSQQFTLLLLPFVVLLAPTLRGALYTVALMVNNTLVEGYIWVNVFPDDRWLLRATVGIRTVLLVLFAVEAASVLVPRLARPWSRWKPAVSWGLAGLAVALALFGGYRLGAAYWQISAARSPRAAAIEAIRSTSSESVLLFTQEELYSAIYPYARPRPAFVVADARLPDRVGTTSLHARLSGFTRGRQEVLLVEDAGQPPSALADATRRWLRLNYQAADARTEAGVRIERYVVGTRKSFTEPAVFGEAIALDWAEAVPYNVVPGRELRVRLDWRAVGPVARDYTVFVHLLDGQQRLVAQRDSPPLDGHYPTSIWQPGERVADEVSLAVPPDLPAGDYYLEIGLYYRPTMERLPARGGPAEGDRALLGPLRRVDGR